MRPNEVVVPVMPGTLLRMFPERQGSDVFLTRKSVFGKEIPFEGHPVFEVDSYVLNRDGGHVKFRNGGFGTFYMLGGGLVIKVKFPYPHPMFEVVDETEAAQIKAKWAAIDLINYATHPLGRWTRCVDSLRLPKWLGAKMEAKPA